MTVKSFTTRKYPFRSESAGGSTEEEGWRCHDDNEKKVGTQLGTISSLGMFRWGCHQHLEALDFL